MKKTALLLIDVQNGMFQDENPVFNSTKLIIKLKHLLENARDYHIPIFYIQHNNTYLENGSKLWEIHPEIKPNLTDIIIQKTTPDAFYKTNLQEELQKQQIEHLVLVGIQSEICVDTTCRNAYSLGYDITLVTDAHSTWDSEELTAQQIINHHNQVLRWFADTKETKDVAFS
ncbi:isochorismatase [Bacillus sp. FJAT-22090]|uniref:cysteine hydrolase family protein n=1 Tax=Bacillus sp. FJAT-22090 TaxID=1581038 RepID=UPI0006B048B6|nr:cysteine hydrolase family protein [Bacillus sp. FJAT-22090]ALC87746.1 isochorismatase [Bacillus sp. FJAT-22090]